MNNLHISTNNLKQQIANISNQPGVYKIISTNDEVLYIGKAKNLKKRLTSYTMPKKLDNRIQVMVSKASEIEVIFTDNEAQALILEACLIKSMQPVYNIKLCDDKNYPYIALSKNHPYPKIMKYRGERKKNLRYFGPFTCATNITLIISIIQKFFKIRVCSDAVFTSRNRPCLEYYINRCSAPCVGLIEKNAYIKNVLNAIKFLNGEISETKKELSNKMIGASEQMQYELANEYKNTITAIDDLYSVKSNTSVNPQILNADFIAIEFLDGFYCIQVFFFRNHCNTGNQVFFSQKTWEEEKEQILSTFIIQFYHIKAPAEKIYTNIKLTSTSIVEEALFTISASKHGQKNLSTIKYAEDKNILKTMNFVAKNAEAYLKNLIKKQKEVENILNILAKILNITYPINLIEAYDNSHNFGDCPVGAIIAADKNGFLKKMYKRFNIKTTTNNDYAMLREVLNRRFAKTNGTIPDLLLIDGGPGHAAVVNDTMKNLNITIPFLCIAKGINRNAGMEKFYTTDQKQVTINDKKTLFYLQHLRDEVHRFAISGYRKKKHQRITSSVLDKIPGIGLVRRNNLIKHFKSIDNIINASVAEISRTKGFSIFLAEKVHGFLKSGK
ncbi:UvrABC system protein C [Candidatus Xenohaliotis californiensis]|uniref:UvrABC system protein C n=1 Tax=Candidatus Xenohaliotis californiensis TaxID=84677 RepID=A0ABP0ESC8_9RICK|nr:UvrABC system protein C [Candidatus Xenohaliotis californiensis]